jgi:Sec-independent protein translocase protein TatA
MNGFGGIGGWELMLLAVIFMAVLGPERMVKHAFQIGRWASQFIRYWQEGTSAFREQLRDLQNEADEAASLAHLEEIEDLTDEIQALDGGIGKDGRAITDSLTDSSSELKDPIPSRNVSGSSTGPGTYSAWVPTGKSRR